MTEFNYTPTLTKLPFPLFRQGKVREVYDIGPYYLFVTSDRVSAFDHVLETTIPDKGKILNSISEYWFKQTRRICPNHMLTADVMDFPMELNPYSNDLRHRSMVVAKTIPIDVECVVRGYMAGSAWQEYQQRGSVAGISLPKGLRLGSPLPEPLFTPAVKNHSGHDENITFEEMAHLVGDDVASQLKKISINLFTFAHEKVSHSGLILADTKFEFGWLNNTIILIDEALTPDSSRYWETEHYKLDESPPSFDKQIVRDYLNHVWSEPDPVPPLPSEVVEKVVRKYNEGFERITGAKLMPF
ncbi:phosphoribosylaminoimidazolesuccinocarboxamide synthase [bacterium]|nr:phosphoribosylaminoimidazolesuccinocarboxamide synthase [bacterium]